MYKRQLVYCVAMGIGLARAFPKHEFDGIENGSSDWWDVYKRQNLSLYTTSSEEVRNIDSKDTGTGIDDIWSETILENATGIALKGRVEGKTRIEIEITIKTENNQARNTYANSAMAQVYSDSEQMVTGLSLIHI